MRASSLPGRPFTAQKFENGRWVDNTIPATPGGLICKDFFPKPDPDHSSCCSTVYQSFSETVQQANEWLSRHETVEVVNCETLPFTSSDTQTYVSDGWPTTTHFRGLRVWLRTPEDGGYVGRSLLSYRDYAPLLDRKNLFSRDYEDVTVLVGRLNGYLVSRTSPARIVSVETVDTPMSGLLEMDVDTDKSRLTFNQHGYTMYCRTLRVFFVTQYERNTIKAFRSRPKIGLKDFLAKTKLDGPPYGGETLSDVMQRAVDWCHRTPGVRLLNLQVLPLKVGRPSVATTWLLESPGHLANKFISFVRVIYTEPRDGKATSDSVSGHGEEDGVQSEDPVAPVSPSKASTEVADNEGEEREDITGSRTSLPPADGENPEEEAPKEDASSLPGVINSETETAKTKSRMVAGLRCKTFVPRLASSAVGVCGHGQWEDVEQTINRLNSWVYTSQGKLLTIHTHLVYSRGRRDEVDVDAVGWARHLAGAEQVGVFHLVMEGGRCATAIPYSTPASSSSCAIL